MKQLRELKFAIVILIFAVAGFGADATVSQKQPSADVNSPTPIALGEVVKGRLGPSDQTGKYHFWSVDLAPGKYQVVLDVRRSLGDDGNVGGTLDWFSTDGVKLGQLLFVNAVDDRFRGIARFEVKRPIKRIIRYSNLYTVADYWLGIFPSSAAVSSPFFVDSPAVSDLNVGQPATATLLSDKPPTRDAYYRVQLSAGDYKISGNFSRMDGRPGTNVGGVVQVFDSEGQFLKQILVVNDIGVSSKQVTKISLADTVTFIIRCRAFFTAGYATLDVEPWQGQ